MGIDPPASMKKICHISKTAYPKSIFVVIGACSARTNNHVSSDFSDRLSIRQQMMYVFYQD